jgi:polyvinyl alcohol dehydrogenase (cytochrome)
VPGADVAPGYAGGAVWASTPVIDVARGSIYISTGNNYTVPTAVLDCQGLPADQVGACVAEVPGWETNYFDSILALDLRTGKVKWRHAGQPFDSWNIACITLGANAGNCTNPRGEDYDFGNGTIFYTALVDGRPRQLLGAGQKSGVYWAIDPNDGSVVWKTQVGPGGSLGGLEWGSAYDGRRIYTAVSNSGAKKYTLASGEEATSGSWAALDPATGKILWQTRGTPATANTNQGPVSVANGVVYAGTIDAAGTMYALEAATGKTLWTFASGGSVNTSPAIVDGTLFWGSGYGVQGFGISPNNKFYAFAVGANNLPSPPDAGVRDAGPTIDAGVADAGSAGAPRWSQIFDRYLGAGTVGHCQNCHADMVSATSAHAFLTRVGQIDGVNSLIASPERSRLTWFGGEMPPGGPESLPDAQRDITAWVAAGALND